MRRFCVLFAGMIGVAICEGHCSAVTVHAGSFRWTAAAASCGLPSGDLSADPVAHWRLDETEGDTAYDSLGDNDGAVFSGGSVWRPSGGRIGGAIELNGVDDYVDCGNGTSLNITDSITVATWVKTYDSGNSEHNPFVIKGDRSYGLKHHAGNKIEFFIYDTYWKTVWYYLDSSFNDVWHHVAGTYDGVALKLYVDGKLEATTPYVGSIAISPYDLWIGRNAQMSDRYYSGLIDDVRIYNRALSEQEVNQLYVVPEPATLLLLGLGGLVVRRLRKL